MDTMRIIEGFRMAAFGMGTWSDALVALARATYASVVHLAGIDRHGVLGCNLLSGATPDMLAEYFAEGGPDPARNPRTRVALEVEPFRCVIDDDLVDAPTLAALPIYRGLFRRSDSDHAAMVRLAMPGLWSSLATMRGRSGGAFDPHECRAIEAIAPALSGIVDQAMQLATIQDGATLDTFETLGIAGLLLDASGRIVSASRGGQALLANDGPLMLRSGRVCARDMGRAAPFERAVDAARDPVGALHGGRRVLLSRADGTPIVVEVSALPQRPSGALSRARVMVTWRSPPPVSGELFADAYGLTRAETAVAVLLAEGNDLATIAGTRGCSLATVRSQVKALLAKTDTRRQGELIARLRTIG